MRPEDVIVWGPPPDISGRVEPIIVWGPASGRPDAVFCDSAILDRSRADTGPVIVWNTRDPLGGMTREGFETELKRLLAGRVESAWIFGSYWEADFNRDSDVDVMLVAKTERPFIERALDYPDIKYLVPDMDLLVYTPMEFAKHTTDPSPGFWSGVVASMRRVM
ncbi:MAG: nucleotidyltransferase domain-containing protein [Spirochaetota bacterium]